MDKQVVDSQVTEGQRTVYIFHHLFHWKKTKKSVVSSLPVETETKRHDRYSQQ